MPCCAFCTSPSSRLQQLQNNVFNVLTYVTRFGQGGGVHDRERNFKHARKSLRQQRLARARGARSARIFDFAQLHVARLLVQKNPLVVVIDRHR